MQGKHLFILLLTFMLLLLVTCSKAQSGHYWTQQYGNKSLLLGGAVTGSVSDLGSVYYNPGFIALTKNPSFMITAKLLQFTNVNVKNGLGDNIDLNKNSLSATPGLIAGIFTIPFLPKSKFAYSYLTRRSHNIDFVYRTNSISDILPSEGKEDFSANINIQSISKEYWSGWSWSYPLNKNMAIGISNFMSITNSKSLLDVNISAITEDKHIVSSKKIHQYEFNNYGMIFKISYAVKYPKFSAGISITPPKINILGKGYMFVNNVFNGADSIHTPNLTNTYEGDYQQNIDAKLKSPLSIAIGVGYKLSNLNLHASIEWFDKVNKYTIMEPSVKYGQSTNNKITSNIVDELSSVVNGGFALEYKFKDLFHFYSGISTDFSAVIDNIDLINDSKNDIYYSTYRANIFHYSGGFGFKIKQVSITLGVAFNTGSDNISSPANLPGSNSYEYSSSENATLRINTWKLLFGFSTPISKKGNINKN